jgi:uncharacterized protein (TIGR02145 family)
MKISKSLKIISLTALVGMTLIGCGEKVTFKGQDYKVITSPITGKKWLDRNLGATQVCISSTDKACYGDYYQWGRLADGHEKASSNITTTLANDISDIGSKFIVKYKDWTTSDIEGDVRKVQWAKIDGTGICPVGFRVPTQTELRAETIGYSSTDNISTGAVKVTNAETAFQNFLKLPVAGVREAFDGSIQKQNLGGFLWTTAVDNSESQFIGYGRGAKSDVADRAMGLSIRCIESKTSDIDNTNEIVPTGIYFKTGQTKSYTIGDDGYYASTLGVARSFTRDDKKQIVTDNITKLQWQDDATASTTTANWTTATTSTCQNLSLGGYSDWRLPTIEELESIVNYGASAPAKYSEFLNFASDGYWSSTANASNSSNAWSVYFDVGSDGWNYKTYSLYVRCVRAGQ